MTASAAARPLMVLRDLSKRYDSSAGSLMALDGINLEVRAGEFVAVVGKSGSGKSTLLNLASGIDTPSSGEVWIDGAAVHGMRQSELARWRGRHLGIVFQFFQLLPTLTVAENVMLPMDFCATYPARERRSRALALLAQLDITAQADKLPSALSGGQQQRAAIARALANDAPILVADEPTGNLDSDTTRQIMQLFADLAGQGKTVLMVTHERDFGPYFTRVVTLADGRIRAPGDGAAGIGHNDRIGDNDHIDHIDHSANRVLHA
ncbi:ABC transporter ATP-binding protein [Rugamonas sp. A1-17]|nr:ABC transporter ATP-binding protein [Rugamonas sp. A1-17]